MIKTAKRTYGRNKRDLFVGDLAVAPIKDKWVCVIVIGVDRELLIFTVAWGDFTKVFNNQTILGVPKSWMLPSAGQFIGTAFDSLDDAYEILGPHRKPSLF